MGDLLKRFDFDLLLNKAYKADDGKMHVIGVASDDDVDQVGDRMHENALQSMADQAKKNKLPLLTNHHDTFGIGKTHDARVERTPKKRELYIDFELDDRYPQATDLFNEVKDGRSDKQLSIGGNVNRGDDDAVAYEKDDRSGKYARVIKKINLDHVATTRPKRAAVPGARFTDAIIKSVFDGDPSGTAPVSGVAGLEEVEKGIVTFQKHPLDQGSSWEFDGSDGDKLVEKGGWPMFKAAHTWFDVTKGTPPSDKAAYKLPHHKLVGGVLKTFKKGVIAAMVRHQSADMPAEDKAKVRSHLVEHYKEFGMTAPEEKHFESVESIVKFHEDQGVKMKWLREEEAARQEAILKAKRNAERETNKALGKEAAPPKETNMADVNKEKQAAAVKGFEALAQIGDLLNKAAPTTTQEPLPEHLVLLEKAINGVMTQGVIEKNHPDVKRMVIAMNKFLSGAGVKLLDEEKKNEELAKSHTDLVAIIEKTVGAKVDGVSGQLGVVLKEFGDALTKGLAGLAQGVNEKIEAVNKSADDRLKTLETVRGVRQSIPGQEQVNKTADGQPASRRAPDEKNVFRGMFDGAIKQALAMQGRSAANGVGAR